MVKHDVNGPESSARLRPQYVRSIPHPAPTAGTVQPNNWDKQQNRVNERKERKARGEGRKEGRKEGEIEMQERGAIERASET